jgi:hypothetical protein
MKKALLTFCLIAIAGILFFACNNGTTGGSTSPQKERAFGADSVAYLLDSENANRSAMARSVVIGNVYEFTIIKPNPQNSPGAANSFSTETINVTVLNKTSLGNGKEKYEVKRSDNGTNFFITFDSKGMYSIQGLQGAKEGFLNNLGSNSNSLDGAYVGFIQDNHGNYVPTSFLINGNLLICAQDLMGSSGNHVGTGESKMPISSITSNKINFSSGQTNRNQTTTADDTGGQWVIATTGDSGNCGYIVKSLEYTLVGNMLTVEVKETWEFTLAHGDPVGTIMAFKRVPTD